MRRHHSRHVRPLPLWDEVRPLLILAFLLGSAVVFVEVGGVSLVQLIWRTSRLAAVGAGLAALAGAIHVVVSYLDARRRGGRAWVVLVADLLLYCAALIAIAVLATASLEQLFLDLADAARTALEQMQSDLQ